MRVCSLSLAFRVNSVFVDRTRSAILTPVNISVAFFAVVLFYYVAVCIRQFVLLNNNLRSHAGLLAREAIRESSFVVFCRRCSSTVADVRRFVYVCV